MFQNVKAKPIKITSSIDVCRVIGEMFKFFMNPRESLTADHGKPQRFHRIT